MRVVLGAIASTSDMADEPGNLASSSLDKTSQRFLIRTQRTTGGNQDQERPMFQASGTSAQRSLVSGHHHPGSNPHVDLGSGYFFALMSTIRFPAKMQIAI